MEEQDETVQEELEKITIVLVGDKGVGKTCVLCTYCSDPQVFPVDYVPTVLDHCTKKLSYGSRNYELSLWEASYESDTLRMHTYLNSDIFLLCFALDDMKSLENLKDKWIPEIKNSKRKRICKVLLGMKSDLKENNEKEMTKKLKEENEQKFFLFRKNSDFSMTERGEKMAKKLKCDAYKECSTKEDLKGMNDVMHSIIDLWNSRKSKK